jgi:hypothetical protein
LFFGVSQQNRKFLCNRILFVDAYRWSKIKQISLGLATQFPLLFFLAKNKIILPQIFY